MTTTLSTRRQFLAAGAAFPFALRAMAQGHAVIPRWIFLGTDKGKGIYRARWNAATGELGAIELAAETDRPDFFALHPKLPVLYTVDSVAGEKAGVSGYRVERQSGALTLINRVSSHGDGPCYVSVDHTGRAAYVANYTGGSFTGYDLQGDGSLVDGGGAFDCRGVPACGTLGPVKDRQEAPHLHCAVVSPKNDFILVCDLGSDAIQVYPVKLDSKTPYGGPILVHARSGSGPRHVAFHPNGKWVYCIHELDSTVDLYDWDESSWQKMKLREDSIISTLAKGTSLTGNTGCEISVSHDGRFVYTCSRGVDEIAVYRVDASTGLLTEQQRLSSGGKIPRYFALDPSRKWLVCCNQGAGTNPVGNVTVFAHYPATGKISEKPKTFAAETPMFTLFV